MKKIYIFCVLLFLSYFASGQDTLIMSDGNRLVVKILDITNEKIQYKTWSNLNGPTWTKSLTNIESIIRFKENRKDVVEETLNFTTCNANLPKTNKKNVISGNTIVRAIDSLFVANDDNVFFAQRRILQYVDALPEYINRQCIEKYYLGRFDRAVSSEDITSIVQCGNIYLLLGAEEEKPRVMETLIMIFAAGGDERKTNDMLERLKEYSAQNDNMLDEDIAHIAKETHAFLHPRRFEDDIRGKWVLLEKVSYDGFSTKTLYSPLILEINNVGLNTGAHLLDPEQKVPRPKDVCNPHLAYNRQINTSQALFCNGQSRIVAVQFASLNIKDRRWLTDLSHNLLSQNQDTRAKMNATIASSKADWGDKMAASAITSLTTSALDALYKSINTSSKTDNVYNMVLFPRTDDVLNAYVSHVTVKTITTENANPRSVYNEYVKDKRMRFVRWEEADSLFFVSANGRPITLGELPVDDPVLDEYWQIRKKHSLGNPAYLLPLLGGNAIGAFLIIKGAGMDEFIRDAYGNKIPNGLGGYLFDDKILGRKIGALVGGGILCFATTIAVPKIMFDNRGNAYMDINRRNLEKLRQKAKVSMSISPSYDPYNNSLGANINLSF